MARGQDTSRHANRQVGRANLFGLTSDGNIGVNWESGDTEAVPLSQLRHGDEDSPMYGKKVAKKHLKETANNAIPGNMFSSNEMKVYKD